MPIQFCVILVFLAFVWTLPKAVEAEKKIGFCRFFSTTAIVEMVGQQFVSLGDGHAVKAISKFGSCAGEGSLLQGTQMFLMDRVLPSHH